MRTKAIVRPLLTLLLGSLLFLLVTPASAYRGGRPGPTLGENGMVVSAHPLASAVGRDILARGGNAVDAAIATAFAIGVVEPQGSGIGGGGFAVLYDAKENEATTLDYRETAPNAATRDMYIREGVADTRLSQTGMLAVAVPGFVRGLEVLHQKKGSLPWKDLLAPAASLARNGFPVHRLIQAKIDATADRFNDEAQRIYMPQGHSPEEGDILIQSDLADTIDAIANGGAKAFYEGKIAKTLVKYIRAHGGILTLKDLKEYQPKWRDPVMGTYRGYQIVSMPPPSSGGIHLVQMLNILEAFDLKGWGYGSANAWHHIAEAMKFAYADRSRWLGDSDFVEVPMARLISKSYADTQRKRIQGHSVVPWTDVGGIEILQQEGSNTSHFSVVDAHGNAVSSTQTINLLFGSAMVVPGTGVILNDEMDDFAAAPGVPNAFGLVGNEANAIVPKKRPLSSMTPTIVLRDKKKPKVFIVAGSPGGSRIINTTLQVILHVIDFAMDIDQAVDAPRIHQQWFPDMLFFESFGMSPDTRSALKEKGHRLERRERIGNAQAILVDPETGIKKGAGDSRGIGQGAGH